MEKKKNVPKLRFPEFTDSWEQCKCGDVLIERNVQHPQSDEFPLVSFTVENGVTPKTERYEREQLVKGDKKSKKYKETRLDDIVYNPANLKFGAIARNKYGNAVFSPIYVTYEVDKGVALPSFIEMVVTRDSFIQNALQYQQGTVYERMSVNTEDFATLDISLPSKEEQIKIGVYFNNIDNLITLHQRKTEALSEYKKGMLEKMFPKKGKDRPEIRFPGFTDAWEQRKLGELCERVTRKNKTGESDLPLTIASQYGLIDQRDFFNKVVAAKDMSNYYLLKKGEFAYNKSYSNGYDFGSIKRLNAYEQGCLSTLYICFGITSDDIESDYLECFFDTLKWYSDITMICAEGARNHGLLNVDTKAFFDEVTIEMPSSKEEQRKISSYLNNLDNLITLHRRKCEELREYKMGLLQQMFV